MLKRVHQGSKMFIFPNWGKSVLTLNDTAGSQSAQPDPMQSLIYFISAFAITCLAYNDDGSCGAPSYSCPQHSPCCSIHGYCGSTEWHCAAQNCLANCWPSNKAPDNTGIPWQYGQKPTEKQRKKFVEEETRYDDGALTQSQIGLYRQWKHFPEEVFGVYVRCIDPGVVALTFDDGPS